MATKFISAITDEAMQKICYSGGGWTLQPYKYVISETDILKNISILDESGKVSDEAYEVLLSYTTSDAQEDRSIGGWHEDTFSSISKANSTTLTHHIMIPSDVDVETNKNIKTIYFFYRSEDEEIFLYAIAYSLDTLVYERGVIQSLFFTFTVNNTKFTNNLNFKIDYSFPREISDHNTSEDVHDTLVKRDGSRIITGTLEYNGDRTFTDYQLVSKQYVDSIIAKLKQDNNLT